tara:strand:+ start:3792 stop:4349 length:558 start_codon:yes stop_codon:yes gene_type:complete
MEFVGDLMNEPWLKAVMFPASGRMTLTVKGVRKAEIAFEGQEPKVQMIMCFQEINSELTIAKINALPLIKLFGNNVALWAGKRVTFYATNQVMPHPQRKDEPCIRVYGSPEIDQEMSCEWIPPKRRKIVQKLHPTGVFKPAMEKIEAADPSQLESIRQRISELRASNDLSEEEHSQLIAKIASLM